MTVQQLNESMLKRLWNKVKNIRYGVDYEYLYNGKEKNGLPQTVIRVLKFDKGADEVTYENIDTGKKTTVTVKEFTKPSRKASPFRAGMDRQGIKNLSL